MYHHSKYIISLFQRLADIIELNYNNKDISIKSKKFNPIKEHKISVLEGLDENREIGEGFRRR